MNLTEIKRLVAKGESPKLEYKRSTGELSEALKTACAFLNGNGGKVVIGVKPDGTFIGQQVSDKTLRDIAQAMDKFEPPAHVQVERVWLKQGSEILIFRVESSNESILRNPIIAEVFHWSGLIEKWGRGTNRVIAQCRTAGIALPEFYETGASTVVTFRVSVGDTPHVTPHVIKLLKVAQKPRPREELKKLVGLKDRMHFQKAYLEPLVTSGWLEMTIPDKPRSVLQRYRTTAAGIAIIQGKKAH